MKEKQDEAAAAAAANKELSELTHLNERLSTRPNPRGQQF